MCRLPYPSEAFDLVVHSDTLEHVPEPVTALAECHRVLRPAGVCAFTVALVVERKTISRVDLVSSYHGAEDEPRPDHLVWTNSAPRFGASSWKRDSRSVGSSHSTTRPLKRRWRSPRFTMGREPPDVTDDLPELTPRRRERVAVVTPSPPAGRLP